MMVAVDFTFGMYLHDAVDLDSYVAAGRRAPSQSRTPQGSVQITASGRRRWAGRPGIVESISVGIRTGDETVRAWVEEREDDTILYRDKRGRLTYAVISDVQITDLTGGLYDLALTLQPVDEVTSVTGS